MQLFISPWLKLYDCVNIYNLSISDFLCLCWLLLLSSRFRIRLIFLCEFLLFYIVVYTLLLNLLTDTIVWCF